VQRFKILAGTLLIIVSLLLLVISVNNHISISGSKNVSSTKKSTQPLHSQNEVQLYRLQQQELKHAIKAYFDKAIAAGEIVGAGISIVRGDSILISDGYGKRKIDLLDKVDRYTLFRLGSLSKGFVGILAADLKDEGKLSWESKLIDYFPEFQLGDRKNTNRITLANILSHTSGAPYHTYTNLVEAGLPLRDIAKHFKDVEPISSPGSLYSYQNALFAFSEEIIKEATCQDITTTLENRFFNPLQMCSTTMDYKTLLASENVAIPHSKRKNRWMPKRLTNSYNNAIAAGGINASTADMARWMRFLLGKNPEIMSKAALKEAFNPFVEIKGHNKYYHRWPGHLSSHYGFGWRVHKFVEGITNQEKTIWHHGGSVNDFRNEIAIYPEADLGICVLLNNNSKLAKTVVPDVYLIIKGIYDRNAAKASLNSPPSTIANY